MLCLQCGHLLFQNTFTQQRVSSEHEEMVSSSAIVHYLKLELSPVPEIKNTKDENQQSRTMNAHQLSVSDFSLTKVKPNTYHFVT